MGQPLSLFDTRGQEKINHLYNKILKYTNGKGSITADYLVGCNLDLWQLLESYDKERVEGLSEKELSYHFFAFMKLSTLLCSYLKAVLLAEGGQENMATIGMSHLDPFKHAVALTESGESTMTPEEAHNELKACLFLSTKTLGMPTPSTVNG